VPTLNASSAGAKSVFINSYFGHKSTLFFPFASDFIPKMNNICLIPKRVLNFFRRTFAALNKKDIRKKRNEKQNSKSNSLRGVQRNARRM
jgi:hypothetical protein